MILTVHTNWEYIHYNTLMISIEGKRQDQDTLMISIEGKRQDQDILMISIEGK